MTLCPQYGVFQVNDCRLFHPNFICDLCGVAFPTKQGFDDHSDGYKHAATKRVAPRKLNEDPKKCMICDLDLPYASDVQSHVTEPEHGAKLLALWTSGQAIPPDNGIVDATEGDYFECEICETQVWEPKDVHESGPGHKRKERVLALRATLEKAEKDKNGVSIQPSGSDAFDFGLNKTGSSTRTIAISLDDPNSKIILRSATLTGADRGSCFSVVVRTNEYLPPSVLAGLIEFNSGGDRGRFQDQLELMFEDSRTGIRFAIVKPLMCIVGDDEDYELLCPIAPYVPKARVQREPVNEYVLGERPRVLSSMEWKVPLEEYKIPVPLRRALELTRERERLQTIRDQYMPRTFDASTHSFHFSRLLHVEEHQSENDLRRYDQEDVFLEPAPQQDLYYLEVPGLQENRPSVIVGDRFLVRRHKSEDRWWEGFVHRVENSRVGIRFNHRFVALKKEPMDVRFCLNRLPLRRMHAALQAGVADSRLFFPEKSKVSAMVRPKALTPFNRLIGSNPPQMLAVSAILTLPAGSPPFVVFGPPGTGKTVTIIEAIRQILHYDPTVRILACAPSNSAADIIAESKYHLPAALANYSRLAGDTFAIPPLEELMSNCVDVLSSFIPYGIGFLPGHFSHIFVDEAGQASEPEALISIKCLAGVKTNVVLSGDPKQLGPIIRSNIALRLGLGISFLERLTNMPLYDEDSKSGITIVKLTQNFRSHPAILKFPNKRFYRGQLQYKADPVITNSLFNAPSLATRGFPIVFHAILGKDMRKAGSPSFFNLDEASLVKAYIQELKDDKRSRLTDEMIGVISPYHTQCLKIRKVLTKLARNVKVGSVEEFQGQERRAMIMSTVRSDLEYVELDLKHTLGFLSSPRRFNVAITRAQSLLIIIGNPLVLSLDPLWRSFLEYIYNSGGWRGRPLRPDWDTIAGVDGEELINSRRAALQSEQEALMRRVTEVVEHKAEADSIEDFDVGDGYQEVERPWKEAN